MATRKSNDFSRLPDPLLELVAGCFRALGDPTRLALLRSLKEGEKTVQDLVAGSTWTQPNISRHLSILARSGLVNRAKRGTFVYYGIADTRIFTLCEGVCAHLDRMLDRYAGAPKR
jgi:DNA-binding transcriptional ArsR family regulator